jgi:transcriptional regulator with PAS, ATPase and Fis domain
VEQALLSGRRPTVVLPGSQAAPSGHDIHGNASTAVTGAPGALKLVERTALRQLVAEHQGSRAVLAKKLGISQRSLYRKLKALDPP